MSAIELRGYAIPFNTTIFINGNYERVLPGAFDAMLGDDIALASRNIDVRVFSHDENAERIGDTKSSTLSLFSDSVGLGFSVTVDASASPWGYISAMTRRSCPSDQCSVNLVIEASRKSTHLGEPLISVTKASVEHIAIVSSAAYGKATGVWPVHCIDHPAAPSRLQKMASQWEAGSRRWSEVQAQRRRERASHSAHSGSGHVPPAVAARLASQQQHFTKMRRMMIDARVPFIMSHVAWTKAGGFKGLGR
ncbi:HK97 family phage prohead protease [Rhodoplanes sp. Z2-YC6860]|uniref:HK97 family phage prohead protease n=1 Tax=Rhodoplanes sp. Z2-YC6860 TaxID=674703 RepID=UPI000833D6EF|nr:HK97 family phage prohead protease [Rhodoplanes sp. Z2-YC6860]